ATTTSTQDSGLLDVLIPLFEQQTGYKVQTVAVGTGAALKMGEEGNADVLLVHAPSSEKTFMDNGFGSDRRLVMHNDFVIVGPADDSAGTKGAATAVEAFQKIAAAGATFVSRGDDSGTNKMELSLWQTAAIDPAGQAWYVESSQGMGATLTITSEKDAYTLTDRATYLANKANLQLEILVEGDPALLNVYHVIIVNHEKWPNSNLEGAMAFADFIVSPATQEVISTFGLDKYGQPLFFSDADKTDADLGLP
ncbi:MAG: tungsten ABC transporter substrate-binding protein, partial [Chloroflexi bacterium CG_4_10_14_0_8_um_filter_57_5]